MIRSPILKSSELRGYYKINGILIKKIMAKHNKGWSLFPIAKEFQLNPKVVLNIIKLNDKNNINK